MTLGWVNRTEMAPRVHENYIRQCVFEVFGMGAWEKCLGKSKPVFH